MNTKKKDLQFAVLGLGRFGMSIVRTLAEYDVNVLACDKNEHRLKEASAYATYVIKADIAEEHTLEELGIGNFDIVILAMGEDFESSVMATMTAKELGADFVMAKARSFKQKEILERIGADQVVLPEHEIGEKIARNLVGFNITDILEESEQYVVSEMKPLPEWIGKTVQEADIRKTYNLFLIAVRSSKQLIIPIPPDHQIKAEDILITLTSKQH